MGEGFKFFREFSCRRGASVAQGFLQKFQRFLQAVRRFVENEREGDVADGGEEFFSAAARAREETDEDELRRGEAGGDERREGRVRAGERDDGNIRRERETDEVGAGIGDDGHAGIGDLRDGSAGKERFDEFRSRHFLVVLVIGNDLLRQTEMIEQDAGVARVFAGDEVDVLQNLGGAARHVRQISDGCRHEIQRAGRDFAHIGSFP